MDRSTSSTFDCPPAVRAAGPSALDLLLSIAAGEPAEPAPAPRARPVVPEDPVLRQPQDGGSVGREPQTHSATDAHSGDRSSVSQTALEPTRARPPSLPVPVARG